MIKLKTLFFLLLFSAVTFAQENYTQRIIFLWDVTYSMHGGYFGTKGDQQVIIAGQTHTITKYLKKYDIYDAAMDMLISDIRSYNGDSIELVVVPFGSRVLGEWRASATIEGKNELNEKIRNFCELSPDKVQATNIGGALEYAKDKVITAECKNTLYLMTDGMENVDVKKFYSLLDTWCEFSGERGVQGYYFALTDKALNKDLQNRLLKTCFEVWTYEDIKKKLEKPMCQVKVQNEVVLSVVDDKGKSVALGYTIVSNRLDKNAKVRFYVEDNPYVALDCVVKLSNSATSVILQPQFKEAVSDILVESPEIVKVFCERDSSDSSNLILSNASIDMVLKNRKIKKMVITVAD